MAYTITHRSGAMESGVSFEALDELLSELLGELDYKDDEHPDVAVAHESGWGLSAFRSGRLIYENVEDLAQEARQIVVDRRVMRDLFRSLAAGDLERLEAQDWLPYQWGDIGAR